MSPVDRWKAFVELGTGRVTACYKIVSKQ